ncbi:MAG: RnfH family protein [Burkholderiales bacterium]|jgi:putative ubiquitin-RnfH superfamily antitoxin RatB of RatAB toxin-antitoxin module|nr:RnfH family protein [Burkholderiales bacterium]
MAEAAAPQLRITVAHARQPGQVNLWELALPLGATVADALVQCRASGVLTAEPVAAGIWGRLVPQATLLQDGDRLELYRPLTVDPKLARRQRFARQGARAAGLFAQRRPGGKQGY